MPAFTLSPAARTLSRLLPDGQDLVQGDLVLHPAVGLDVGLAEKGDDQVADRGPAVAGEARHG
jgi:hypothetical protein